MREDTQIDSLRASIEEELGSFRHFADLPATEIEAMAARLLRVIATTLGVAEVPESRAA